MPEENTLPPQDFESNSVEETTAPAETASEDEEFVYDEEDFDSGFVDRVDSLMGDLNLTRKHFILFSGCVVILIIGIVFSFIFLFRAFGDDPEEIVATPVVEQEQQVEEVDKGGGFLSGLFGKKDDQQTDLETENDDNNNADEIDDAQQENTPDSTSISASVGLGDASITMYDSNAIRSVIYYGSTQISEDKLSYYVRSYRKIRNIFNTDLFAFLNTVEDRESAYENFLAQFKGANEQAKLAFEEIRQDVEVFDQRLARLNDELQVVENEFFEAMDTLDSERLPDLLDSFQDLANKQSIIKSELLAREAIGEKYLKALPVIESKIQAVTVNKDAFVKGVKVVEYQTVDLDLIIQGTE